MSSPKLTKIPSPLRCMGISAAIMLVVWPFASGNAAAALASIRSYTSLPQQYITPLLYATFGLFLFSLCHGIQLACRTDIDPDILKNWTREGA